ncbi:MAG TPA: 50S ribosomal protein L29 [Candidatus Marinimicrobia bacterium]|nr:MAG: 50S ribosomal protein L29 [Candidatus Marinimicrobia bacterium CG1_02_48_14]PIZ69380.1 MAG: 50S ribosomal protein L29 [Candidatus Marinimicrobia bacterium CG_4_10_14_0_2_um_filter_48_9]PJA54082.1 MAG: 50S ribosomal protein L29 [Candidatus Marinimicrobia bacterium CG_4_9_14_3_um_filter_48_9]HCW75800.1 50S ribosomal protein L29 [Candidatus Neomarinimicrobiota bacterium]
MKQSDIAEFSVEELKTKLADNEAELSNLRFQQALQQLEKPSRIRQVKREIAQIKTVLREFELGTRKGKE